MFAEEFLLHKAWLYTLFRQIRIRRAYSPSGVFPSGGNCVRDGASDQKWELLSLDNEFYKIISSASGKVITAPSTVDGSLTQQTYSASNNAQQWRVIDAGDGTYTLSLRSNASYRMAVGDGTFTAGGRNVEMRSNQSDNKDNWILHMQKDYTLMYIVRGDDIDLVVPYIAENVDEALRAEANMDGLRIPLWGRMTHWFILRRAKFFRLFHMENKLISTHRMKC